jgi:hypothetical protein
MRRATEERNRTLVEAIRQALGDQRRFDEFRRHSAEFRRGAISAEEYWNGCVRFLGQARADQLFPELAALLPDNEKRLQLLQFYAREQQRRVEFPPLVAPSAPAPTPAPAPAPAPTLPPLTERLGYRTAPPLFIPSEFPALCAPSRAPAPYLPPGVQRPAAAAPALSSDPYSGRSTIPGGQVQQPAPYLPMSQPPHSHPGAPGGTSSTSSSSSSSSAEDHTEGSTWGPQAGGKKKKKSTVLYRWG